MKYEQIQKTFFVFHCAWDPGVAPDILIDDVTVSPYGL